MRKAILLLFLVAPALIGNWLDLSVRARGQESASKPGVDTSFDTRVARPAYGKEHPKVLFDVAHNNDETPAGQYKPFADLISSDGYAVARNARTFSPETLKGNVVLVIVNASGPAAKREGAAFTEGECDAVRDWVSSGGALLLITDSAPFSTAVSGLSNRFDVDLTKGYTIDNVHYNKESEDQTELVFTRENHLVGDHAITRGRDATEGINRIISFSGTSLKGPKGGVAFLKLSDAAMDVLPPDRKPASPDQQPADHKTVSAAGRAQAVALEFGKGRVIVVGEAAMFTAQVALRGFQFGMNVSGTDNRQLALNMMHWLSGILK